MVNPLPQPSPGGEGKNYETSGKESCNLKLRSPDVVMRLKRLGSMHPTRLSFTRSLIRQLGRENWRISTTQKSLNDSGYGRLVYKVDSPHGVYSFVAFSQFLDDAERTDRVIAEKWDTSFALVQGEPDEDYISALGANVIKQELGRYHARDLVLSRANKSVRLFEHVVDALANGRQPDMGVIAPVGYLLRTTAVYGNGKFGIADFSKINQRGPFTQSFRAQMLAVYLARQLSLDLVEHIAYRRNPEKAVTLDHTIKRSIGVGNATGLGMAPFLMGHPKLINQWFQAREIALARVRATQADEPHVALFEKLLVRTIRHFELFKVGDEGQQSRNYALIASLSRFQEWFEQKDWRKEKNLWDQTLDWFEKNSALEAQECMVSLLIELYPEQVDELENTMISDEVYVLDAGMLASDLKDLLEKNYAWGLGVDYNKPKHCHFFWYRSANKEEPRLGERFNEPGAELETAVDIGRRAAALYEAICVLPDESLKKSVAEFLLEYPHLRGIVRRVQSLQGFPYAEIRDNTLGKDCLPVDILRAKLATFGASKFDPKSDRWTRITLFQGAPLPDELQNPTADDWLFPVTH